MVSEPYAGQHSLKPQRHVRNFCAALVRRVVGPVRVHQGISPADSAATIHFRDMEHDTSNNDTRLVHLARHGVITGELINTVSSLAKSVVKSEQYTCTSKYISSSNPHTLVTCTFIILYKTTSLLFVWILWNVHINKIRQYN